jgi:hypothetical protein
MKERGWQSSEGVPVQPRATIHRAGVVADHQPGAGLDQQQEPVRWWMDACFHRPIWKCSPPVIPWEPDRVPLCSRRGTSRPADRSPAPRGNRDSRGRSHSPCCPQAADERFGDHTVAPAGRTGRPAHDRSRPTPARHTMARCAHLAICETSQRGATLTCFGSATRTSALVLARRAALSRLLDRTLPLVQGSNPIQVVPRARKSG